MYVRNDSIQEYKPRLIIWQVIGDNPEQKNNGFSQSNSLNRHEKLLTLEGIASVSKPIVVLTGDHILRAPDTFEVVQYGHALGLKMIIEAPPEDLTPDIMRKYSGFGSRIFRIKVDGCIIEDMDSRYQQSDKFAELELCIRVMRREGFEIHFSLTINKPDIRSLGFSHDFAYRTSANGLYCHLSIDGFNKPDISEGEQKETIEEFIEAIAKMKRYSPDDMYFSPQCIQYGYMGSMAMAFIEADGSFKERKFEWRHWCLGGKRFVFISPEGRVQLCKTLDKECGDLRTSGFDFGAIWQSSEVFEWMRSEERSCTDIRDSMNEGKKSAQTIISCSSPVPSNEVFIDV